MTDLVAATLHYEELRVKFIEALEELRDLPRDEEDEGGVRSKDVAEQISIIREAMSQAAQEYGRIFMMDRTLEYIERKPSLDSLIWRHQFPGSLSKSLYLTEGRMMRICSIVLPEGRRYRRWWTRGMASCRTSSLRRRR